MILKYMFDSFSDISVQSSQSIKVKKWKSKTIKKLKKK